MNPTITVGGDVNQFAQQDINNSGGQTFNNRIPLNQSQIPDSPAPLGAMETSQGSRPSTTGNILQESRKLIEDILGLVRPLRDVYKKDIVLLVGNTGVGKSTMLNSLVGNKIKAIDHAASYRFEVDGASDIEIGHEIGKGSSKTVMPNKKQIDDL